MRKLSFLFILLLAILFPNLVLASDADLPKVTNAQELVACLDTSGLCKLTADIQMNDILTIKKNVVLDLNGKTLMPASDFKKKGGLVFVEREAKLTVNDSIGTGKISTGAKDNDNVWAGIQLIKDNDSEDYAELVVNGGTIEGYYYGIVGNGNNHNTRITITGGTIAGLNAEDSAGIYHPQVGELLIYGGTIKGGTGIEIRSGKLDIRDGTIEGIAPNFIKKINDNGSTTNGVGVAVAQHTTKNSIDVKISGGNISGQYAFYEWNPHSNGRDALDKISLKITGGTFDGTATGVSTVYSEDYTNFISGGKFNKSVSKYLTDDAQVASKIVNEEDKSKPSKAWIVVLAVLAVGVVAAFMVYKFKV